MEKRCDNCLLEYPCSWEPAGEEDHCKNWKPEYQESAPSRQRGIVPVSMHKICLCCRKRWPIDMGREYCDCEQHGHLYVAGVYMQRQVVN